MRFLPATVPTLSVSLPSLQPHGGIATFLHTVWINRTKNALWTAQSRSNSSRFPLRRVCVYGEYAYLCSIWEIVLVGLSVVLVFLRNIFASSTTFWLNEASMNGMGSEF